MILEDLARESPMSAGLAVPAWTLGCWVRRSITFATGDEECTTRVVWLQSHGLTGDLRVPVDRSEVEGGVADTRFDSGRMSWHNWASLTLDVRWPEPGELRRVGGSLLEFAPSGVYVEDWRLQPRSAGLLVGLRLVAENGQPAAGGLLMCGDHALLALGGRAVVYAVREAPGAPYVVRLATAPAFEGEELDLSGFAPSRAGFLVQQGPAAERHWRIDTLLAEQRIEMRTPATAESLRWLHESFSWARSPESGASALRTPLR